MDPKTVKKAVNLSGRADLIEEARKSGVNLSALLEQALRKEAAQRWLADNREATENYNREVEQRGVWSDGLRTW